MATRGLCKVLSKLWGFHSQPGTYSLEEVAAAGAEIKAMGLGREGWEGWEQREHRKQLSHRG